MLREKRFKRTIFKKLTFHASTAGRTSEYKHKLYLQISKVTWYYYEVLDRFCVGLSSNRA